MAGLGETIRENAGALLATLQKDPLTTLVGQKIEQATDASLASENWALNMEICDIITETDEGPKDAAKAIRKRLMTNAGKNYTVVMYTLTVLETCVKNCGRRFHLVVSQKDFVQDLVKLIGPKNDPPTAVQEKVLSLIQNWATAFRSSPEMQGVVQVYTDLKGKGVEFPQCDAETMVPIHTPQRTVSSQESRASSAASSVRLGGSAMHGELVVATPVQLTPKATQKLKSELDVVQRNMHVFGEMLNELEPGYEHPRDWDLLQELLKTCHAMQTRIVELVDKVSNEQITSELLRLNDELNNLFIRYERFEKRRSALVSQSRSPLGVAPLKAPGKTASASASAAAQPSASLIDFGAEDEANALQKLSLGSTGAATKPKMPSRVASPNENDEFEAFAQSRTAKFATPETLSSLLPDNATDFQEMEKWLEAQDTTENPTSTSSTGAVSSSDFDRFLQERAAAADRLPTIQAQAGSAKETKKDEQNLLAL